MRVQMPKLTQKQLMYRTEKIWNKYGSEIPLEINEFKLFMFNISYIRFK